MIDFINTTIFMLTVMLGFELYVRGVIKVLVEAHTDDRAEVMGVWTYYCQAFILSMFVFSCLVDIQRHAG